MGWPKWNWNDWRAITDVSHVRGAVRGYTKSASSGPLAVHIFSNCWKPVRIPRPVYYRSSLYGRHTPHKLRFDIAFSPNSNFSFTMLSPKRIEGVFGFSAKPNISSKRPTVDVCPRSRICQWFVQPAESMRITHIRCARRRVGVANGEHNLE